MEMDMGLVGRVRIFLCRIGYIVSIYFYYGFEIYVNFRVVVKRYSSVRVNLIVLKLLVI